MLLTDISPPKQTMVWYKQTIKIEQDDELNRQKKTPKRRKKVFCGAEADSSI